MRKNTKRTPMLKTLTKASYRANRSRNLVAILAIVLTTVMFTSLFVLSESMMENLRQMNFRQAGTYSHMSFKYLTGEQAELLKTHPEITGWGESIVIGIAEDEGLKNRQVEIRYADDTYAAYSYAYPTTGAMPIGKYDIALDTAVLDALGLPYELGQKITLHWRDDLNSEALTGQEFVLCGYWEGNASSLAGMAFVSKQFAAEKYDGTDIAGQIAKNQVGGTHMLSVMVKQESNLEETAQQILSDLNVPELSYGVNWAYDPQIKYAGISDLIPMLLGMILVFVSGYLIIYNIFQISVVNDIQFYGKLKTLGTTGKQIRKLLYAQAGRLCLWGIPAGLLIGYGLGSLLVPVLILSERPFVSASPVIFLGAAIFAWVTVRISCRKPAKAAGKISPVEALKYSDVLVHGPETRKTKKGASISRMALSNLGRNKKRTATVICSLTLGMVLLSCVYAKNKSFDLDKYMRSQAISDFTVMDLSLSSTSGTFNPYGLTLSDQLIGRINQLKGLQDTASLYAQKTDLDLTPEVLDRMETFFERDNRQRYEAMQYDPYWIENYDEAKRQKKVKALVFGIDGFLPEMLTEDAYVLEGAFDAEKFQSGNYVIAGGYDTQNKKETQPTYQVGSKLTLNGKEYEVMAVIDPLYPAGIEGRNGEDAAYCMDFFLPAESFLQIFPDSSRCKYFFQVAEENQADAEKFLEDYRKNHDKNLPILSKATMAEQYRSETMSTVITGMAVSIIIAFVGILNFINSMVTAIVSRKKEFAMIQSVGMTTRQLRNMLIFEGLYYAVLTLAASYLTGTLAVGIGVRMLVASDWSSTFRFTILPLVVCTPVLLLFAVIVPCLCFRNIEKISLVDRLRAAE